MFNKICLVLALCALTLSVTIKHQKPSGVTIVGGYNPIDVRHLNSGQQAVDKFIRESSSDFNHAELVKAEQQVVAGMNYKYTYKTERGEDEVVVNQNLKGKLNIASIKPVEEKKAESGKVGSKAPVKADQKKEE